ncbi:MAG TPA: TRAP transporter small permease [Usitatibacter sp.]|nr:TRAP transporter small permease [Usitatibacter sp.]
MSLAPDAGSISPRRFGPAGRALAAASRALALAGGAVFLALVAMSVASIVGRKVASAPIPGDVEMLQMSAAFACACFFAHCHLMGGDVKVDFFTARLPRAAVHRMDAAGSLLYALVGAALAWRTAAGALGVRAAEETSVILGWPVWVAQALMVPGFVLMALAGLYMAALHLRIASRPQGLDAAP